MSTKVVSDGLIEKITFYQTISGLYRYDVLPFLIVYSILFSCALSSKQHIMYFGLISLPISFSLHIVLFLLAQWSVKVRAKIGNKETSSIHTANSVHVTAAKNAGKDKLVNILRIQNLPDNRDITIAGKTFNISDERLEFQKVTYNFDKDKNNFVRLDYPSSGLLKDFLEWRGHRSPYDVALSLMRWGINEFDIPIPNFLDLYLDHLVAPFFVFQVLCLFLWSLDDYWYYSVFTLLMLMVFEGMMCKQRQASLMMLRNMRRPPVPIFVYREQQWVEVSSEMLAPGDVISLSADALKRVRRNRRGEDSRAPEDFIVPCDALLLRGSCMLNEAMLTGESVPQMKDSLEVGQSGLDPHEEIDLGPESSVNAAFKRYLIFSGTALLMHSDAEESGGRKGPPIPRSPDGGCIAMVVRTGFGTSQGGLMRKILFARERVTGDASETFYFIGVLVVFAVIAAAVVLQAGLGDERRNQFRLVLHCIMIVTSVVPPELPMELSLAVTNSLAALGRSLVYCTEPFRISYAGRLDVLCFDKTGTLTKDQMMLKGVVSSQDFPLFTTNNNSGSLENEVEEEEQEENVFEVNTASDALLCALGGCHDVLPPVQESAVQGEGLLGDPLEVAAMESSGFTFDLLGVKGKMTASQMASGLSVAHPTRGLRQNILKKFPFTSALKRMSVISQVEKTEKSINNFVLFCKGAPEVLVNHLKKVPKNYHNTYYYHMCRGKRVLAVACKTLETGSKTPSEALDRFKKTSREEMESDLTFIGFLIFDCDLKVDSKSVLRELRQSNHRVVMITGDSAFTAADVARRLGILNGHTGSKIPTTNNTLILQDVVSEKGEIELVWRKIGGINGTETTKLLNDIPFQLSNISKLTNEHTLCVTGPSLVTLEQKYSFHWTTQTSTKVSKDTFRELCPYITIFARVSPAQKESILLSLNDSGLFTLMCGDGTNDVGALKAAHVGVSIVNDPLFEKKIEGATADGTSMITGKKKAKGASARDRTARALMELQEQEQDPTVVKLGDASIASPFTARRTSIDSVLTVVRQGRCTLVTTIQVYKVLALNCLVTAYMMSALYLRGLKQGDTQMTASGLIIAGLFFFLSQAKPLANISPQKPCSSIFALPVGLSILGQFIVHFVSLIAVLTLCQRHVTADDFSVSPDGKFQPNVVNSAVFVLSAMMQINNFVVNYRGHPYTESITENLTLWRSIQVLYGVLLVVCGGQLEPLNDLLQLAPFPSPEFQTYLILILVVNFAAAYGIERFCQTLE